MGWALGIVAFAAVGWAVLVYNRLVGLQKRAEGAWADIDAQLKRRHDLVPALVATVKGYASHERTTLEDVVARRGEAARREGRALPDSDVAHGETLLVGSLRGLFALAEDYPDLKASQRFGQLQQELSDVEDQIQHARRYYNAVIRDLNTMVARFPDLLVARASGFAGGEFFELASPLERQTPRVDLDA